MRAIVVTGTNTGVGKTIVTAALAARAAAAGHRVAVVKPAQTGITTDEPTDAQVVGRLAAGATISELASYDDPLAPDTAARLRGVASVPVAELARQTLAAAEGHDLLLVEGAGGVLVRLDEAGGTLIDLADALAAAGHDVRVVVVTSLALGTLNHTELTVGALRRRGLLVAGLVIGSRPEQLGLAESCNTTELPRVTGVPVLGSIPAGAGSLDAADFSQQAAQWIPGADPLMGG